MKFCPNCGNELEDGVTRCWNPGCDLFLGAPNRRDELARPKSDRLRELELEYQLARMGLVKGIGSTVYAMISGLMTLLAVAVVAVMSGVILLSGNQLVVIFGILAFAVIIYFAFVFGRAARIKAEITAEKKQLEIEAGRKVR